MSKKRKDWGSLLLVLILIVTVVLFCFGKQPVLYNEEQTLQLTSCGLYDDGIFEYDTLEFYAINKDYESEFLAIPAKYENFTVDSVNARAFLGTPVRHVLLPETIASITYITDSGITMYTDDKELAAICLEKGFCVDSTEAYAKLLEDARKFPFGPKYIVSNATALAGSFWIIAVVLGLYVLILLCAHLREKAGYDDPLYVLKKPNSLTNSSFILVQVAAAFIMFYFMLFETEEIGFDSEWLMEKITNWPLKIAVGLLILVLVSDIFNKNFFPWYFGRVLVRLVRVLIPMGIAAALGAFVGTVSLQFRFIVHLIAAAPIPLFYFLIAGLACFVYARLGIYKPSENNEEAKTDPSDGPSHTSRSGGTTTLIAPDGTSYPVHNVGYGYMVNGKLLRNFDPHGTNNPVDEDGTEYTRY